MQFTLYYCGPLKSNARPIHKHDIRKCLHRQLKELWQQEPLIHFDGFLDSRNIGPEGLIERIDDFFFAPLICKAFHLLADIEILMMRPGPPGSIVSSGGDIDNRLKTLLDALKIPREPNELPSKVKVGQDEKPFFCLLQDDSLISKLSVETTQLLEPTGSKNDVVLFIRVSTVKTSTMMLGDDLP